MTKDDFGDRMKMLEGYESARKLFPILPAVCRCDGICFHGFCKSLAKPYDERLSNLMVELAKWLIEEFSADCAYTQSDEISLGWNIDSYYKEMFCGGKIQKLNSHLAAKTSVHFNKLLSTYMPEKTSKEAYFDARIWNVPNLTEATNVFLWREQDATRNSVQMAGHTYFSQKVMHGKNNSEIQEMLFNEKHINWNDYPTFFKRGSFIVKKKIQTKFTDTKDLPLKHVARQNPDLMIERTVYHTYNDMPPFTKVVNREKVLFFGEEPQTNA